jgi:hypothetical protein
MPALHAPCACRPSWDEQDHVEGNYERAGLVADVNAAFGRNRRRDVLQEKVEQRPELLDQEPDDEFKAACAQVGGQARWCGRHPRRRRAAVVQYMPRWRMQRLRPMGAPPHSPADAEHG